MATIKKSYKYELLRNFCLENNIELLKDYINERLHRYVLIEGKCIKNGCDKCFSKTFQMLLNSNGFCEYHKKQNRNEKLKKNNLIKYGVENVFQNKEVKEKIKNTCLKNYGVEYPSQNEEVRQKQKNTCLQKYGVEHALQNEEINKKQRNTCLKKFGVNFPIQKEEIKEKQKNTSLERYGTICSLQNDEVKEKIKITCLEKYGTEHPAQNEEIKEKSKTTCLKKYGTDYPMQNVEVMDKNSKNAYKLKNYTLPSGKEIKLQGYEHFALKEILQNDILEEDIIHGCKNVPEIWYEDEITKKHRHYVDFFIPSQNKCIEVKSNWTIEKRKNIVFLKQKAGKKLGYQYEIWVYNGKGEKVDCYD